MIFDKHHQTLVIVRNDAHAERAQRFVDSLNRYGDDDQDGAGNGSTIKADIVQIDPDADEAQIREDAKNFGYRLVVLVA